MKVKYSHWIGNKRYFFKGSHFVIEECAEIPRDREDMVNIKFVISDERTFGCRKKSFHLSFKDALKEIQKEYDDKKHVPEIENVYIEKKQETLNETDKRLSAADEYKQIAEKLIHDALICKK